MTRSALAALSRRRLLSPPAEAVRNERDAGDGGEKRQDRDDDDRGVVEVLVLLVVHDVQRPEEVVDAPEFRAARGHLTIIGADIDSELGRLVEGDAPSRKSAAIFGAGRGDEFGRGDRGLGIDAGARDGERALLIERRKPLAAARIEERRGAVGIVGDDARAFGAVFDREADRGFTSERGGEVGDIAGAQHGGRQFANAMFASDLFDWNDGEEEARRDPDEDLDANNERQPFVNERRQPSYAHDVSPSSSANTQVLYAPFAQIPLLRTKIFELSGESEAAEYGVFLVVAEQ